MKKRSVAKTIVLHLVLVTGCVIFAFPFMWLVSTSFKESDEIFTYPPQWIPRIPEAVRKSPYVATDEYDPMERPEAMTAARWRDLEPKIRQALWEKAQPMLPARPPGLETQLVQGLWDEAYKGIPDEVWSADEAEVLRTVTERIDANLFEKTWRRVFRSLAFGTITVQDVELKQAKVSASDVYPWRSLSAEMLFKDVEEKGKRHTEAAYDFGTEYRLRFEVELALPIPVDRFRGVSIGLRADKSWHPLGLRMELGGKVYRSEEPLLLANDLWQEAIYQLPSEEDESLRVREYILLREVPGGTDITGERCRLTFTLSRSSHIAAVWNKFTRNYWEALRFIPFWRYTFNSVFLVALNILGELFACSLVAYSFARLKWPGRDICFVVLLGTMMLPPQVTMIPVFLIFKHLGWFNTLKPLWVPSFLGSAFFIFLLRQFMKGIPTDLEDAAKIDGCSFFGIYWRIILPLIKPALAAIAIFTFMNTWNNFMGPLIYVNDQRLYPLSLGLFIFQTAHRTEFGMLMAASTLMTLPVVVMFFTAQRYFIQGVTLTGMKG
ncbi:MAG: ABC transporter permease subunit [Planctomycetota bacterium]